MTLDEALAYDASPSGHLACQHWCDTADGCTSRWGCTCGMERARDAIVTLQGEVNRRKEAR